LVQIELNKEVDLPAQMEFNKKAVNLPAQMELSSSMARPDSNPFTFVLLDIN
jgi:hypothetical protein